METKQWNALLNESIAACDMSGVLQQADNWFNQGFDYLKACNAFASSYAAPQKWLETADGVSKTMAHYVKDWARIYGLGRGTALDETMAAQKTIDAALKKIQAEKADLKRTLSQRDKTLETQRDEIVQQKNRLGEKEKEIETLQAKVKAQAERLILLEAASKKETKPAARPQTGATVPPAGKQ